MSAARVQSDMAVDRQVRREHRTHVLMQGDQRDDGDPEDGRQQGAEWAALPQQEQRSDRDPEEDRGVDVGPDVAGDPRHAAAGGFEYADALAAPPRATTAMHQYRRADDDGDDGQHRDQRLEPHALAWGEKDQCRGDQRRHASRAAQLQVQVGLLPRDVEAASKIPQPAVQAWSTRGKTITALRC